MQGRVSPPVHRCVCPPASWPGCIIRGLYGAPVCRRDPPFSAFRSLPSGEREAGLEVPPPQHGSVSPVAARTQAPPRGAALSPAPRLCCSGHLGPREGSGGSASEPGQTPDSTDFLFTQSYRCTPISVCGCVFAVFQKGGDRRFHGDASGFLFLYPPRSHVLQGLLPHVSCTSPTPVAATPSRPAPGHPSWGPVQHPAGGLVSAFGASKRRQQLCPSRGPVWGRGVGGPTPPPPVCAPDSEIPVSCLWDWTSRF